MNEAAESAAGALLEAAARGDHETVVALLAGGAPVNATDENGTTPLMKAVQGNHLEATRALLEGGAEVALKGRFLGYEAIVFAVKNGNAEILALLLERAGNVSAASLNFALGVARLTGNTRVIELLQRALDDIAAAN